MQYITGVDKALVVLKAMNIGIEVKIGDYTYGLDKNSNSLYCLHDNWGEKHFGADMSLRGFLNICEQLSEDEIFIINANIVLNSGV